MTYSLPSAAGQGNQVLKTHSFGRTMLGRLYGFTFAFATVWIPGFVYYMLRSQKDDSYKSDVP